MKVFLGGTCAGYDYRKDLIPKLQCDYFNPVVEGEWTEAHRLREVAERESSDKVLYTITNGMKGVYSIAEITDDSNKRPDKTIYCNLYQEDGTKESHQMAVSLKAVGRLVESNGAKVVDSLEELAEYLNQEQIRESFKQEQDFNFDDYIKEASKDGSSQKKDAPSINDDLNL